MAEMKREGRDAADWERFTRLREPLYSTATRQMIEAALLKPGDRVLDIAAGTGDQSRVAARLVGAMGSVLATDISREMLDVAARQARREGLDNITTRVMNAEQLDLPENSFDAAISRLGLMLVPRKHIALTHIQRVLKPGGRLVSLVWSLPERNPLFALYIAIVKSPQQVGKWQLDSLSLADAQAFSLAHAERFANVLTGAGFFQVEVQPIALTFRFPSFEMLIDWWGSDFAEALEKAGPQQGQRILAEVRREVSRFENAQGIVAPAELLLGVGSK